MLFSQLFNKSRVSAAKSRGAKPYCRLTSVESRIEHVIMYLTPAATGYLTQLVHDGGNPLRVLGHDESPNCPPDAGKSSVFARFFPHLGVMSTVGNCQRIYAELY